MERRKGGGRLPAESRDSNRFHDTRVITLPRGEGEEYFSDLSKNGEKFVDSIVKRAVSSIMENNLKRIVRRRW